MTGNREAMLPRMYLAQLVWPWSGTCSRLFVPWASVRCWGYGLINVVAGVVFRSKWMTRSFAGSNSITHGAVTQVLRHENEALIGNHRRLMAFCGKEIVDISTWRCLVRKSMDSSGNVDLNDQPRSRRPVTAVHYVNGQKADELFKKKSKNLSDSHSGKAEDWCSPCQWD